ncbi:MAG: hypothetical protein HYY04_08430 [Chloroflexi bacterium]|nr:hypothetical protein [Chloroflexota bacterium]
MVTERRSGMGEMLARATGVGLHPARSEQPASEPVKGDPPVENAVQGQDQVRLELTDKLVRYFRSKGFEVRAARLPAQAQPPIARNDVRIGDREDKQPDVYGFDPIQQVAVRGIVKTSADECVTEHTRTQLLLFSQMTSTASNKRSLLYIIVPAEARDALNNTLKELSLLGKPHVVPLALKS